MYSLKNCTEGHGGLWWGEEKLDWDLGTMKCQNSYISKYNI